MSGVFREISITCGGKDCTITPSNKLLRRIEGKGDLSILAMIYSFGQNKPRMSEAAFVLAELLKDEGATVDEDSLCQERMTGDQAEVERLLAVLFEAIMPQGRDAKKNEAVEPRKKLKK